MKALIFLAAPLLIGATEVLEVKDAASTKETPKVKSDETTGSIQGHVVWEGAKPKPKPDISITDQKQTTGCHEHGEMVLKDNTLLIDDKGGVANIVMTIKVSGAKPKVPSEPVVVDQKGCRFEPHVMVLPVGTTVQFKNSDAATHNVHTFPKKNKAENKNVAGGGTFEQKLDQVETFQVKCDIHPWMKQHMVVTDAAYHAISDAKGNFEIKGLPAGDYTLSWWHEELGKGKTEKVTVKAGEATKLTHKVGEKKKKKKKRRR